MPSGIASAALSLAKKALRIDVSQSLSPSEQKQTRDTIGAISAADLTTLDIPQGYGSPEAYGAVGDGVVDDTIALQRAWDKFKVLRLSAGKTYRVTQSLVAPGPRCFIEGSGGVLVASFGTSYSTALITNNKSTDITSILYFKSLRVVGNCVVFDFRFTANNPGAGLQIAGDGLFWDTLDGNRRPGTKFLLVDQIDFMNIRNVRVTNCDQVFQIGSDPATRRNCTQLELSNFYIAQVNATGSIRGVDKLILQQIDTANCGSGISFLGNNRRIVLNQCHVEALGATGYSTSASDVPAASLGYGYYFSANIDNDVTFNNSGLIDVSTGGLAKGGIFIGQNFKPGMQSIHFVDCGIPTTMTGSASYKPIVNRGSFRWTGLWPYKGEPSLFADGQLYQSVIVNDSVLSNPISDNLLPGTSVYSLTSRIGATLPVVSDVSETFGQRSGQKVEFTTAGDYVSTFANLPVGYSTLIFQGRRIAGNPKLFIEMNGSPFTSILSVLIVDNNGEDYTWYLPVYNSIPNQSYRVGIKASLDGDKISCSYIGLAMGVWNCRPPTNALEIVSSLPPVSVARYGKTYIVRTAGVADYKSTCLRDSSGSPAWVNG